MSGIKHLFEPLELVIRDSLLPILFNQQGFTDLERELMSLPAKHGGLGIFNPVEICDQEYSNSINATKPIVSAIHQQKVLLDNDEFTKCTSEIKSAKSSIRSVKTVKYHAQRARIKGLLPPDLQRNLSNLWEKGVSSWLTSLPLVDFGFILNKTEFQDALRLRYVKPLANIPKNCACGKTNSIDHSLSCKMGGFVSLRHNQVRDLEAGMLSEVCKDVVVEPHLAPLTGERFFHKTANTSSEARLDVSARGLWNTMDKTFVDVRVFHHECPSNNKLEIGSAYKKHEGEKKRGYNARVLNVEKATFTPLVFSTHGGMGKEAEAFHKRLASLIATKRGQLYSDVMSFVRRRLRFCILRSCLAAIRGYRGKPCFVDSSADINLIPEERGYF